MINNKSSEFLTGAYAGIDYGSPPIMDFMAAVLDVLRSHAGFTPGTSLLDIGCGRGYFLKYLADAGYHAVAGVEPDPKLRAAGLSPAIHKGGFGNIPFGQGSFDIVYCCHVLHHLSDAWPVSQIREMAMISRGMIVIVEVNNSNLPMLLRSLWRRPAEMHAWRYNRHRVKRLADCAQLEISYEANLRIGFLSGNSLAHQLARRCGSPPYCVLVGHQRVQNGPCSNTVDATYCPGSGMTND